MKQEQVNFEELASRISLHEEDHETKPKKFEWDEGWYEFSITDQTPKVSKSGKLMVTLKCSVVEGGFPSKRSLFFNLTLPLRNPENPDIAPPNTKDVVRNFLRNIGQDSYSFPIWDPVAKTHTWNDKVIPNEEANKLKAEVHKEIAGFCNKLLAGTTSLKDLTFYGKVEKVGEYTNITKVFKNLPEDEELVIS